MSGGGKQVGVDTGGSNLGQDDQAPLLAAAVLSEPPLRCARLRLAETTAGEARRGVGGRGMVQGPTSLLVSLSKASAWLVWQREGKGGAGEI